jgi:thioredoxin reductase (NADPH)
MANPIILVVDDEPLVLNAIERDLRRKYGREYRIAKATSGAQALEFIKQLQGRNDLVALFLSDQRMPLMSGVQFLEQAREAYPDARKVCSPPTRIPRPPSPPSTRCSWTTT